MRVKPKKVEWAILAVAVIAMGILAGAAPEGPSRLVSVQQLPENMEMCAWNESVEANPHLSASLQQENLFSALQQDSSPTLMAALQQGIRDLPITEQQEREAAAARAAGARVPVRTIRDTAPTYSAIAFDANSDEVILQDNNLWSYRVFDRLDNTPPDAEMTQPKRIVQGDKTALQFNNGLYVDPQSGDIFSVESDTGDKMVRFPRGANGNVSPKVILHTPHRVYNIAADEVKQELFVTVEFPPEVVVYRKDASGEEQPLRRIAGENTGLDAPHGIAVDEKNRP